MLITRCILLSIILSLSGYVLAGQEELDSLERSLGLATKESLRVEILHKLAEGYSSMKGQQDQSIKYAKEAISISKANDWLRDEARGYQSLGNTFQKKGNAAEALESYLKELSLREKLSDSLGQAKTYRNIGLLYYVQEQNGKALDYFVRGLELANALGSTILSANFLVDLGLVYDRLDHGEKALKYLKAGLELKQGQNDLDGIAFTFNCIGNVLLRLNRLEEALLAYQNGIVAAKDVANDREKALSFLNLSDVLLKLGDDNTAITYALDAVKLLPSNVHPKSLTRAYGILSNAYERKAEPERALHYLKLQNSLEDSLALQETTTKLQELELKYESEKKENEIAVLNAENRVKGLEIAKKNEVRNYLLVGLLIILVSSGLLLFSYQINRRNHRLLLEKSSYINKSLMEKEVLLKEVHHRVKNNLQLVSSMLNIQSRYIEDEQTLKMIKDSQDRIKAMSIIHQELYEQDNLGQIRMRSYVEKLVSGLVMSYSYNRERYVIKQEVDDIKLSIDSAIPIGLILNELITNAFKYAFKGREQGEIVLGLTQQQEGGLMLSVKDDGVGLSRKIDMRNTTSYGMKLVSSLARKLKAEVTFAGENGTLVTLLIKNYRLV